MWGDKTAVNLELKDLSCDVAEDESVQDFEVQISSELEPYFHIEKNQNALSVVQTSGYWTENRPGLIDLLHKKKVTIKVGREVDELTAVTSSILSIDGLEVSKCSIKADAATVKLKNSHLDSGSFEGSSCSIKFAEVSVADRLTVDFSSGSYTWTNPPQDLDLHIERASGKVTFHGKNLAEGSVVRTAEKPVVTISCRGGSVTLGNAAHE